jgi:prepilin-type N-terminal cleavage/methylation domain-containing protein
MAAIRRNAMRTRHRRSGFTLVEVLTVIAIIALLAALILGLAGNAQKKAARSKAEAEIAQLENFVTDYQMKFGQVPQGSSAALKKALATEMHSLSNMVDPWGGEYQYTNSSKVTFYLWSLAGDTNNNRAKWIGNPAP